MTGALPRYEPLEHTSEAGVIAHGATLAEAFANAAEGMYDLMLDLGDIEPPHPTAHQVRDVVLIGLRPQPRHRNTEPRRAASQTHVGFLLG